MNQDCESALRDGRLAQYRDLLVALKDAKGNAALMWASRPKGDDPLEHLLHGLLHVLVTDGLYDKPLSKALVTRMCVAIDRLHHDGVAWPSWNPQICGDDGMSGPILFTQPPITRKKSHPRDYRQSRD